MDPNTVTIGMSWDKKYGDSISNNGQPMEKNMETKWKLVVY